MVILCLLTARVFGPVLSDAAEVVLSDGTSLIRVELWGPAAKAHVAQITAADEADGFAEVKLRSVEVGSSRNGAYLGMKLLQVLPTSEVQITGSTAETTPSLGRTQPSHAWLPPQHKSHATTCSHYNAFCSATCTSLNHRVPKSPLPKVTTSLSQHFPKSPLPLVTTFP